MIRQYNFPAGAIKITVNEDIADDNLLTECFENRVKPNGFLTPLHIKSVGLEVMKHTGGMIRYGFLNSILTESESDSILLSVFYTQENMYNFCDSILYNKERCFKGLLKDYLGAIVKGASRAISESNEFPLCNVSFVSGANCDYGSSDFIFERIAESLIQIIPMLNHKEITESILDSCKNMLCKKFGIS